MQAPDTIYRLGNDDYEVIKEARLAQEGVVLRSREGDSYARLGPTTATQEEQAHTVSLFERGFPVPRVLESGAHGEDRWFYVEKGVGDEPFQKKFVRETRATGAISDRTFQAYMNVIARYVDAQVSPRNRTTVEAAAFVGSILSRQAVLGSYCHFGFAAEPYDEAISRATERLQNAPMGILQFDFNPYNVLPEGVIDFELVGEGPIGYDVLMSARWGRTWFTAYPSRYPVGHAFSREQVAANDELVSAKAREAGLPDPVEFIEEFLLIKTAWALMVIGAPQPNSPQDQVAFRRFRANLLDRAVNQYLAGEPIDYWNFASVPGGEVE